MWHSIRIAGYVAAIVAAVIVALAVVSVCTNVVSWSNKNPGYVTALTGVLLAIFTSALWLSTHLLWRQARDQATITKTALLSSERPYVFRDGFETVAKLETVPGQLPNSEPTQRVWSWRFNPIWTNAGKAPTKYLVTDVRAVVSQGELAADFPFDDSVRVPATDIAWVPAEPAPSVLGPGGRFIAEPVVIRTEVLVEIWRAAGEGRRLYIWGWAEYDDRIDGPRHRTEFCVEVFMRGNPAVPQDTFSYRNHRFHNGADEDCMSWPQLQTRSGRT